MSMPVKLPVTTAARLARDACALVRLQAVPPGPPGPWLRRLVGASVARWGNAYIAGRALSASSSSESLPRTFSRLAIGTAVAL